MSFATRRMLEGGSVVRVEFDRDPAVACPGGRLSTEITLLRQGVKGIGVLSLGGIDDWFETLDYEGQNGLLVNNDFPVFMANIDGAREVKRTVNGTVLHLVCASIRLAYCTNLQPNRHIEGAGFSFLHTPDEHRVDAIDTAAALAEFALFITRRELPGWQLAEPETQLLDPATGE